MTFPWRGRDCHYRWWFHGAHYQLGDQICIHWQQVIESGELAVVRVRGEVVTFKQIRLDAKELHRLNDAYLGREFSYEKVEIIGRVIQ